MLRIFVAMLSFAVLVGCHGGNIPIGEFDVPVASGGQVEIPARIVVENTHRLDMEYRTSTHGCHPSLFKISFSQSGADAVRKAVRKKFVRPASGSAPLKISVSFDDVRSDAANFIDGPSHSDASMRVTLTVRQNSSVLFSRQNLGYAKEQRQIKYCNELEGAIASAYTQALTRALVPLIEDAANAIRKSGS